MLPPLLLCGAATSQTLPSGQVINSQVQLGDIWAGQQLNVESAENGASAVSTAMGNSAAAGVDGPLNYRSHQTAGNVGAQTDVTVGYAGPALVASTAAYGNSGTAEGYGVSGVARQTTTGAVSAGTNANLYGYAGIAAIASSAVGNTQGWQTSNGSIDSRTHQTHSGSTWAGADASVCCSDQTSVTATAISNNVTASAPNSPVQMTVRQHMTGSSTEADANLAQVSGGDLVTAATATANNLTVGTSNYAAEVDARQDNAGAVTAQANGSADQWWGTAATSAYGVGNSAVVSNAGSWTGLDTRQTNNGQIYVAGSFSGGAGGDAVATSTAIGNAVSGYACGDCNGVLQANNRQINNGGVTANTNLSIGSAGVVSGAATAIGNSANYVVRATGSH